MALKNNKILNFHQIQKRNKVIKYFCLVMGVIIALYTSYELMKNTEEQNNNSSNYAKTTKNNSNFSISVEKPVLEGVGNDNLPYVIKADSIIKNLDNQYILLGIDGEYTTRNDKISLKSDQGVFDQASKKLYLANEVEVSFAQMQFNGSNLYINIQEKNCYSNDQIVVNYGKSTIQANKFHTQNESSIIVFQGDVKSCIKLR